MKSPRKPKPKPKRGRPTVFTAGLGARICERLVEGESLRAICLDAAMPARWTVFRWLAADPAFRDQYAHAREVQADLLAEQIIEIADTPVIGVKTTTKPDGSTETVEGDMIEHRRLQVDARKWFAGKVAPKKYGERVVTEHAGPDGGPIEIRELTDLEAARRIAWLLGSAAHSDAQDKD